MVREESQAPDQVKLVVDTNIVFSAVLNSNSRIARVLIGGRRRFEFYSCEFLHTELIKHRGKLQKLTKLSDQDLDEVISKIIARVTFIYEGSLPSELILETERKMAGNDLKDVPFVAMATKLKSRLWTGDKALAAGLKITHPRLVITTADLLEILGSEE